MLLQLADDQKLHGGPRSRLRVDTRPPPSPLRGAPSVVVGLGAYYVAYLAETGGTCCAYMLARFCR